MLANIVAILVMILGFGFVIFWHELGHFLGARWAKMRVEQFAVGMGHAVVSYRKGIGLKLGSTREIFEKRTREEFARRQRELLGVEASTIEPTLREQYDIAKDIGLGETEYRLSWIPIGGYVKPTGQDDLRPAAQAAKDDPGSYAAAPVGKRMVMISAGVIMNVILAGILFFVLFYFVGFNAPKPIVSSVQSNSPAAEVGLIAGDELLELNGHTLHDFNKVRMWTALMPGDESVDLKIRRDGKIQTLHVSPRPSRANVNMLSLGIGPAQLLRAAPADRVNEEALKKLTPEQKAVLPGEKIVAVNGQAVTDDDYPTLDRAVQASFGAPVQLTIEDAAGKRRDQSISPIISDGFDGRGISFVGLQARTRVGDVMDDSCAKGKLLPGDIIFSMRGATADSIVNNPSNDLFRKAVNEAGAKETPITFTVIRGEQTLEIEPIVPTNKLVSGKKGLNIGLDADYAHAVVASAYLNAVAATTETLPENTMPGGATITAIDGKPVSSWLDVHKTLLSYSPSSVVFVRAVTATGEQTVKFTLDDKAFENLKGIRYESPIRTLDTAMLLRETSNPLTAFAWGVSETRDLILQTYITLRRVFGGSVPASNLSGPVGIFNAGRMFALQGPDAFIWFLALVSANLAVVNFLPVPILDGWHFLSLLKEKITGTPVNERLQEYASWLGLAMILSLLIFVTFNDLTR